MSEKLHTENSLTHIDKDGNARMVDVSKKAHSMRIARASGRIYMKQDTLKLVMEGKLPKGDVLAVARVAGIMAAKKTQELIPMCHQVPLDGVEVLMKLNEKESCIEIEATAKCIWKTGVEMEALTAVSVCALTLYDMCKAVDKTMTIGHICLAEKIGGRSGHMKRNIGKVVAVNISTKKGVPKDTIDEVMLIENFGLENDAHGGNWHRQVSLLGVESIEKMTQLGIKGLCSGKFAENITTENIELYTLPVGTIMTIGDTIMEVTQIGKECHQKCAIFKQIGDCVMPTEGIFTKVIKGGKIKAGDEIIIIE